MIKLIQLEIFYNSFFQGGGDMLKKTTYFAIGRLTVILVLFVSCLSATSS